MARTMAVTCESCHHWRPAESMPYLGECDNPSSGMFRKPTFSDKQVEECFAEKALDKVEFVWCQTHHQTIHCVELPDHEGCSLFAATAPLPVEDMMEFTLAGD